MGYRIYLDAYIEGNFGDDLLIWVLCRRYPEHTFYLMCDDTYLDRFGSLSNLRAIGSLKSLQGSITTRSIEKVRLVLGRPRKSYIDLLSNHSFDMYLVYGGSLFIQSSSITSRGRLSELYAASTVATVTGVLNCNFGPFQSKHFLDKHRRLFRSMDFVSFRDSDSYRYFSDIQHATYGTDISFSLLSQPTNVHHLKHQRPDRGDLVICPVSLGGRGKLAKYKHQYAYTLEEMARKHLCRHIDNTVSLVPCCETEGDIETCTRLSNSLREFGDRISIVRPTTIEDFLGHLSQAALVLASRLHAICVSLSQGRPVYAVSYSGKITNLFEDLSASEHVTSIEQLDHTKVEGLQPLTSDLLDESHLTTTERQFAQFEYGLTRVEAKLAGAPD